MVNLYDQEVNYAIISFKIHNDKYDESIHALVHHPK